MIESEKFSYALGLSLASNMLQSGIKNVEYAALFNGIGDVMEGKTLKMSVDEANQVITEFFRTQQANIGLKNQKEGQDFLEKNSTVDGVVTLANGLQYSVIMAGNGPIPKLSDKVKCHYHGTMIDGTVFDSSVQRGQPAVFPVSGVIKGWIEALQIMPTGSKWKLFIPPHLAYGEQGAGGSIGPEATLIFEVELLEII